ncbi:hypothetical protein KFE25_009740 [Diacronema lutheri]|uniref:Glycine zipper domain-containing protein n=1 Tax=Diacronema lutheri TaxID=2081491 RepID=A0A8J5Y6K4_DIALT|nr:hypothetical protein KFE25_009740 [Diacronema lutheri]
MASAPDGRRSSHQVPEPPPGAGVQWTLTGALGGAVLGLTLAGPVGAVAGFVAGAAGGSLRDRTGKSALEHFDDMPHEERERLFQQAASRAGVQGGPSGGGPTLTRAELEAIPSSRAPSDAVACKCPVCRAAIVGSQRVFL